MGAYSPGISQSAMDKTANPCQDFYQYACGNWEKETKIPHDKSSWYRSFSVLDEDGRKKLKVILENYASGKNSPRHKDAKKMGLFYKTCMDKEANSKPSTDALKAALAEVDNLKSKKDLPAFMAKSHLRQATPLFDIGSFDDFKNPTRRIGVVDQNGLGLPNRDYYLENNAKKKKVRKLYKKYIKSIFNKLGVKKDPSKTIIKMETDLAKISMDKVSRREPKKIYNKINRKGLKKIAPSFDWDGYFKALGYPKLKEINVTSPSFFKNMVDLVNKWPMDDLKNYLKWHTYLALAPALNDDFVNTRFAFTSKALTGAKELPPQWKRCVTFTEGALGFSLAKAFVDQHYGRTGKIKSDKMVRNIQRTFGKNLKSLDWMDDKTKKKARKKLRQVKNRIGYPQKWRNYSALKISDKPFIDNYLAGKVFETKYELNRAGKKRDPREWSTPPHVVNAFYNATKNLMMFPAGILQLPFFDPKASDAFNYGAIGMVIGHELTHGFDDKGRKFNGKGVLTQWWTPESEKAYSSMSSCIVDQYQNYKVQGINVNGKYTLGENIADNGGIKLSYEAWQRKGSKKTGSKGIPAKQEFFLAYAQSWCAKVRPEYERTAVTTNVHSPPRFRVNGPLSNTQYFAEAFGCKVGDPMAPKNRCQVW